MVRPSRARWRGWLTRLGPPDRRIAIGLFLLMLGIFGLTAGGHTYSGDEEGYYQQARALSAGSYSFPLPDDVRIVSAWMTGRDGLITAGGGIGAPVFAVPLTLSGRAAASSYQGTQADEITRLFTGFTNTWVGALLVVICFLLAREIGAKRRGAVLLSVAIGLGTLVWSYAHMFLFSELLTATLICAGVLSAMRCVSGRRWLAWSGAAGVLTTAAVFARATALPFIVPVGAYVLVMAWRRHGARRAAGSTFAFAFAAACMLALLALASWWRYGSSTNVGYGETPAAFSVWTGLSGLLLSPGKSIFIYAPIALVALIAIPWAIRRRPGEVVLIITIALINLAIFAPVAIWSGDEAWGPRYMLITLPLFILILAPVMNLPRWPAATAVAGSLGIIVASLGIVVHPLLWHRIAAATYGTAGADSAGTPKYIDQLHFNPTDSPPFGHLRILPDVVRSTAIEAGDGMGVDGRGRPFPDRVNRRYEWAPDRWTVDIWWVGWQRRGLPGWVLLLTIPLLASTAGGLAIVRRPA